VNLFRAADAIRVVGPAELPLCVVELLSQEVDRSELARRALATVRAQTGATQRTLERLAAWLSPETIARTTEVSVPPIV